MTAAEHCRVELKVPKDDRAPGALRGALQHSARHLGFPAGGEEKFIAAADRLLRAAFSSLPEEQVIVVRIEEYPDRIEVEMTRPGGTTPEWDAARSLPGIDRADEDASRGQTHLKLVKFLKTD